MPSAALSDVKIVDLMWALAGPTATRVLADYGACVVRVESTTNVDPARTLAPFHGGTPGAENSGLFGNYNAGKYGIALDLNEPEARRTFLDLVDWADVVAESFAPGVMGRWGFDYEALRALKPNVIMVSTSLFGQYGPLAGLDGYGTMGAAFAGFSNRAGWPDRDPVGPFGAYTDYLAPRFTISAILAALEYREQTGQGVYIDQSQVESAIHFLTPTLLRYQVTQQRAPRAGNRDPQMSPHGVFRALGEDSWVAICVRDQEEWVRFCALLERPDLGDDPRFQNLHARKANEDALEAVVEAWSSERGAGEVETLLQAEGIPAHVVQGSRLATADPQLAERGHFVNLPHPLHGTTIIEGSRFALSRTPATYERCAPTLGRDNEFVLREILNYDDDRIASLTAAGALG